MKQSKYRKIIPVTATAAMVASVITPTANAFHDSTGQYKDAISYVTEAGIANGVGNGYFGVSQTLKRGDAAVMIAKALGLSLTNVTDSKFTDVNERIKPSVDALYSAGIINGKTRTSFAPNDEITRVEMAKILANAYKLKSENPQSMFKDVNSNWTSYVSALVESGIAKGKSSTEFGAQQSVTRGEFALFMYRGKDHLSSPIVDTVAPVIQFTGEKTISVEYGANLTLPTITATDDVDVTVEVTSEIKNSNGEVISQISTTTPGTYTVTFNATDLAGNKAEPLVLTVIVNSYIGGGQLPPATPDEEEDFELSIMHFNDTHAHLDNAAKRVTAVKAFREEKPDALLLDAGDVFSGTLYFNEFKGQADLRFMNLMKVDAMTFGNHEFDLGDTPEGHKALAEFIKAAQFPFVSSNVDFSKDELFTGLFETKISSTPENGNIYTGIVKEVNGEKVGIFGLTTADTKDISSPKAIEFSDYIEEAKKMVAEFEKMGINKIIAITHIGYDDDPNVDNDIELAKAVEGIDIIVGGHSHTTLSEPDVVNGTVIVQTGQYADNLGTLNVKFDKDGVVTEHNGKLIKIADFAEDPEAKEILEEYSTVIDELKNEETGAIAIHALENPRSSTGGNSVRSNETPLGNLITDGMLAKAKVFAPDVIMAMQNGGGIRASIDEGPITVGEVITVLPFGNTLATMKLTGAEIKEAFETSLGNYPGENGGFLHVSGAKVEFDSSKPAGERVVSVKYNSGDDVYIELEDEKTYTIATNAFTAKGGDGFDVFKKAYEEGRVIDLGLSDWENLREHIVSLVNVDPKIEGRIVDIAAKDPAGQ